MASLPRANVVSFGVSFCAGVFSRAMNKNFISHSNYRAFDFALRIHRYNLKLIISFGYFNIVSESQELCNTFKRQGLMRKYFRI